MTDEINIGVSNMPSKSCALHPRDEIELQNVIDISNNITKTGDNEQENSKDNILKIGTTEKENEPLKEKNTSFLESKDEQNILKGDFYNSLT